MATDGQDRLHVFLLSLPALHGPCPPTPPLRASPSIVLQSHSDIGLLQSYISSPDALGENLPHFHVEVVPDGLPTHDKCCLSVEERRRAMAVVEEGMEGVIERSLRFKSPSCFMHCLSHFPLVRAAHCQQAWSAQSRSMVLICWKLFHRFPYASAFLPPLYPLQSDGVCLGQNDMIEFIPGLLPMRVTDLPKPFLDEDMYQFFAKIFEASKKADWILLNTVYELEGGLVECLRAENLHVLTVGPLIPEASDDDGDDGCLKWLDAQDPVSVVYVAFGSVAPLSETEVKALAVGLQRCQKPFLWALRSPFVEHLPHAFTSETESQGVIVPWAPQFSVLCHPSVGAFISHCGWNSMMESFHAGVPIIGWPIQAEQNTNLKFIAEEWKVGIAVEAEGERESRCMSGEAVERAIRRLMEEEEGRDARKRLGEMSVRMKRANEVGGSSSNNVERFMGEMWARVKGQTPTDM